MLTFSKKTISLGILFAISIADVYAKTNQFKPAYKEVQLHVYVNEICKDENSYSISSGTLSITNFKTMKTIFADFKDIEINRNKFRNDTQIYSDNEFTVTVTAVKKWGLIGNKVLYFDLYQKNDLENTIDFFEIGLPTSESGHDIDLKQNRIQLAAYINNKTIDDKDSSFFSDDIYTITAGHMAMLNLGTQQTKIIPFNNIILPVKDKGKETIVYQDNNYLAKVFLDFHTIETRYPLIKYRLYQRGDEKNWLYEDRFRLDYN